MEGGLSCSAVTTPERRSLRKGTSTRPPTTGWRSPILYVNAISRGTGRATSQNVGMGDKGDCTGRLPCDPECLMAFVRYMSAVNEKRGCDPYLQLKGTQPTQEDSRAMSSIVIGYGPI